MYLRHHVISSLRQCPLRTLRARSSDPELMANIKALRIKHAGRGPMQVASKVELDVATWHTLWRISWVQLQLQNPTPSICFAHSAHALAIFVKDVHSVVPVPVDFSAVLPMHDVCLSNQACGSLQLPDTAGVFWCVLYVFTVK